MESELRRIVLAQAPMGDARSGALAAKLASLGKLSVCVSLAHTLSLLEQASADLLLLDLDLPDASGGASIARVRRSFPRLPIVAISAQTRADQPSAIESSRRFGAVACWSLAEAAEARTETLGEQVAAILREAGPLGDWHMALGCRLLLADPLESRRGPLAALLEIAGARVARAVDGRAALAKALTAEERGEPFAAVLLADSLPGLDDSAAEVLREAGYRRPIIGLASAAEGSRDAYDEWLAAPIDRNELLEALRRCTS